MRASTPLSLHILIGDWYHNVKITTVLSLRDPEGVVAISQNHLASCMYSGEYETFFIRLPRRFAPRNDTPGVFSTRWEALTRLVE